MAIAASLLVQAGAASAEGWAVEGYGGVRFEGNLGYGAMDFDTDQGTMFGARVLYTPNDSNLSFGAEYNRSQAEYTGYDSSVNSQAILAVGRYTFPSNSPLSFYAGLGLGAIEVEYDGGSMFAPYSGSATTFGGQVSLGVSYDISERVSLLGEFIHQRAFDDVTIAGVNGIGYSSNNVVVGVRFEF
ncbi:outer membrane protein [Pseudoruegeria sp. HB172150]|uniref:outer membrane protein n=1 Tax=Pseudoruegeria sp. HB172150 TaxID=2721164 RepID=UPI001C12F080|nr:outer membrane beta-barrel protein [Pseudoruegeria sp. HB172150]